jgi:hypothetical protein
LAAVLKHGRTVIAATRRAWFAGGRHRLSLQVPAAYRRHRRLSVALRISIGGVTYTRPVTLSP